MGVLQIVSHQSGAGKTSLAAALLIKLARFQASAAYYQPFFKPDSASQHAETEFLQTTLLNPSGGPSIPPARPLPSDSITSSGLPYVEDHDIRAAVEALLQSAASVIVDGPTLDAASQPIVIPGAKILVLFRYSPDLSTAEISQAVEAYGSNLAGISVTLVTKHRVEAVQNGLLAELRSQGIPVAGLIPETRILRGPTVRQIAETLNARWVQEPTDIDLPVERFLIGGNIMDTGPEYYGRYDNQAVIVRSQRPDIQMASLLAGTRCLVLTEDGDPTEYVKAEALQRDVPLMVVSSNTSTTVDALAPLAAQDYPLNLAKITKFADGLDLHLEVEDVLTSLA